MINIWLVVREEAKDLIVEAIKSDPKTYNGPVPARAIELFKTIADGDVVRGLFKTATIQTHKYFMFSIYIEEVTIAEELAYLVETYPTMLIVGGAWKWNGQQIAGYPPHPQLIKMMPDIIEYDEFGTPTGTVTATSLTDVNLLLGQSPREFV